MHTALADDAALCRPTQIPFPLDVACRYKSRI
jgi:hypothetical protein